MYDDEKVRSVGTEILNDSMKNAYVLIYERVDDN